MEKIKDTQADIYNGISAENLAILCRIKDKTINNLSVRLSQTRNVIKSIAKRVGINTDKERYSLYNLGVDGSHEVISIIDEYMEQSESAQLKKRIKELESENRTLRNMIWSAKQRRLD